MSKKEITSCEIVQGSLADYSVGILDARQTEMIKVHLESCKECSRELQIMAGAVSFIEALEEVDPPAGVWEAVYEQITEPAESRLSFGEKVRALFAPSKRVLAAGFAVLIILVMLTFTKMQGPFESPVADASTYEYVQGHAMFASQDAFSNRAGLASVTGAAMLSEETHTQ